MKFFVAVLTALVVLPLGAALGYVAKQDPALPAFGDYLGATQTAKHVAGQDTDEWLAVAVTGPHKDAAMDAKLALAVYATHGLLEQSAGGKVIYVERKCLNYTGNGKAPQYQSVKAIRVCSSVRKTRRQVEDYMREQFKPEPKS